jgi:hypothetical protein
LSLVLVSALPENHDLYFLPDPEAKLVPIAELTPSKPPATQPGSVDRAEELMRRTAAGEIERRAPISVTARASGYTIIDGNATYGVALRHGWRSLPTRTVAKDTR